jgi:hypothetical protein
MKPVTVTVTAEHVRRAMEPCAGHHVATHCPNALAIMDALGITRPGKVTVGLGVLVDGRGFACHTPQSAALMDWWDSGDAEEPAWPVTYELRLARLPSTAAGWRRLGA